MASDAGREAWMDPVSFRSDATGGKNGFALQDATFTVAGRVLLAPLTLTVPPNGVVGLIGHNGSGKSTLIKLLARQQRPSTGTVSWGGTDLRDWRDRPFARQVAYLPQVTSVASGMLAGELVALGRYAWHGALGRFGAADRAKVDEAMALTDVASLASRGVNTLSGGERQRVWLAMLLAQDTRCLLLDEPTSALDIAHQIEMLSLIKRLVRQRGTSAIIVLHDINMAARFCDEILALHSGQLIARGTPAELVVPASLQRIFGVPMGVFEHPDRAEPICFVQ